MIGRERERELLRLATARAADGGAGVLLIVGEPGIGKSTLLSSLSELARESGFAVGFARGQPEGAVPLWPWRSALASVAAERDQSSDEPDRGRGDYWRDRDGSLGSRPDRFARFERFAMFERFAEQLGEHAAAGPVALLLDDLQWTEISSLRLVRHLLDRPPVPRVLIAGAVRTTEPLPADVSELLSGLVAHPASEIIELAGLDVAEIAKFAAVASSRRLTDADLDVLARRSGGNPFLLAELCRWLPASGATAEDLDAALPLAVRESVRRRLVVEADRTQEVVKAAAVAGTAASLELLATVTAADGVELGPALDSAVRAGLLTVDVDPPGAVRFVHDLVREAVLSLMPTWGRLELHRAVGTALQDDVASSSWATVAAHLNAAGSLVDRVTVAEVARRAATEATLAGASDEAAGHLAVALDLTEAAGDTTERGTLLLQRGRVLWAAERPDESKTVLGEAAALARRTGDWDLLAQVALSWRGGELRPILRHADFEFLGLLREAMAAMPPDDSPLRCLLLARLALCGHWDIGDRDGIAACDEAVAMGRRLGDPEALINALGTRFYYRWRPDLARERLSIADEILAVALATADAGLVAQAGYFRLVALLDLGWLRDAWVELDRFEDAAEASGQPMLKLRALWFRATQHFALGDRVRGDEAANDARRLAARMGRPDAALEHVGQSLLLRASEGRVEDALALISPGLVGPVAHSAVVALANGLAGRPPETRASLAAVVAAGLERFPRDMSWLFTRCGLLSAAVVSGDRDTGQLLYDALTPFAGRWAMLNPGVMVLGAIDHYLGLGAALLGRLDDAIQHLKRAAAAHEAEQAVGLALLSLHEIATALARRADPADDGERAEVAQRIAGLAPRNTVPFKPLLEIMWSTTAATLLPQHAQRIVLEGDTWLVEFAGRRARLRDQRGLHHLRTLLERPGVEVPARTLAATDQGLAGSNEGTILDERAMREYRRRITDLHEDIDEATAYNDMERSARAEAELDVLVAQLASATGVGGRPRQFTGADERARVSVTKAIRSAISHVGVQLPELGRHLSATVHTGHRCVYLPDPRAPQDWSTEQM